MGMTLSLGEAAARRTESSFSLGCLLVCFICMEPTSMPLEDKRQGGKRPGENQASQSLGPAKTKVTVYLLNFLSLCCISYKPKVVPQAKGVQQR